MSPTLAGWACWMSCLVWLDGWLAGGLGAWPSQCCIAPSCSRGCCCGAAAAVPARLGHACMACVAGWLCWLALLTQTRCPWLQVYQAPRAEAASGGGA